MSERFEARLKSYHDSALQAFVPPPVKVLADRAGRRVRARTATATFTGVVAVAVGVAAVAGGQGGSLFGDDPSPTMTPTPQLGTAWPSGAPWATGGPGQNLASPATRVLPRSALLQQSDVGNDYTANVDKDYEVNISWGLGVSLDGCPRTLPTGEPTTIRGTPTYAPGNDTRGTVSGWAGVRFDRPGDRVSQHLRYNDAEAAVRYDYDMARLWAGQCRDFTFEGRRRTVTILEEDFAGDTSILVRLVTDDGFSSSTRYHAFVRKGTAYTEIAATGTPAHVKALAQKAVERMCAASLC